jgi:hypothetical protein
MHAQNPTNSEVDAYSYIKEQLELLGWVVKNPARVPRGEVYKQNEALSNKYLKKALVVSFPATLDIKIHFISKLVFIFLAYCSLTSLSALSISFKSLLLSITQYSKSVSFTTASPVDMREEDTTTLVNSVNNLISKKLREVGKENFFNFLKLELPPTTLPPHRLVLRQISCKF